MRRGHARLPLRYPVHDVLGALKHFSTEAGVPLAMAELNRRRFLQLTGGAAALTMLNESIARAAAIPAQGTTGTIADVEHIVVLMQENRSFDHYFGSAARRPRLRRPAPR